VLDILMTDVVSQVRVIVVERSCQGFLSHGALSEENHGWCLIAM